MYTTSSAKNSAIKRLYSDMAELLHDPVWRASALPLSDNVFEWHANICGPVGSGFEKVPLHFTMTFSEQYPSKPPIVRLGTSIMHPNVMGHKLCLDMLEEGMWAMDYFVTEPYTGWSSAYSVSAILRQLQVFLLDRKGYYKSKHEVEAAHAYHCKGCQHTGSMPWPPMQDNDKLIETRLLKAPKMATSSKAMARVYNSLKAQHGEEEYDEEPEQTSASQVETKENVQPNIQPLTSAVNSAKVEQIDTRTTSPQVTATAPVTPVKASSQPKKQSPPKPKQNNNRRNPKVSSSGFIIEEVCAVPQPKPKGKRKVKSQPKPQPNYVDQLIKESIRAEQERQARAQQKKAKKAAKLEPKPVEVAPVTPVKDETSDVIVTPPQTPSSTKEPNVVDKPANTNVVTVAAVVIEPQVSNGVGHVVKSKPQPKPKKQTKPKNKQINHAAHKKPVHVPISGFIIEEEGVTQNGTKSASNYVDTLIKETIAKEKEKQQKAQQKRAKKAQKVPAARKPAEVVSTVTPVNDDTSSVTKTPVKTPVASAKVKDNFEDDFDDVNRVSLSDMPYDVLLNVIQYFSWTDLTSMACVNKQLSTITQESHVWKLLCMNYLPGAPIIVKRMAKKSDAKRAAQDQTSWREMFLKGREFVKNELRCFHSKLSFEDDVLGIPLNVVYGEGYNKWIVGISTTFDIISKQAFYGDGIRKACWKQPFKFWLPIFVNKQHASAARRLFENSVERIVGSPFKPTDVLTILPKLMSTMVVEVSDQKSHASEKALEGYCWFHRWFLEYVTKSLSVKTAVNQRIASFIQDPAFRSKKFTQSIGEWICLLSVSDKYGWSDASAAYVNESFDRNAKWILQKFPELAKRDLLCDERMRKTFEASLVSIRLLMFHVFFLDFVRPRGLSLERIKEQYDAFYGMLSHSQKVNFQKGVFDILNVDNWEDFFIHIKLKKIPTEEQFEKILINGILNSHTKGYHKVLPRDLQQDDLVYALLK